MTEKLEVILDPYGFDKPKDYVRCVVESSDKESIDWFVKYVEDRIVVIFECESEGLSGND